MISIIAEPGSTAEGDFATFHRLIAMAAAAGCTAFKPQWTSNPERLCARRHAPEYRAAYEKIAYPLEWHAELGSAVRAAGMRYVVTVYLPEDVPVIAPYVDVLKCASFEARDYQFLGLMVATGKQVFASTGMLTFSEAMSASAYATVLFHCTSAYVAPVHSLNLRAIATLKDHLRSGRPLSHYRNACSVGYSDHSANVLTGAIAVAAGAQALEVHCRLDDCDPTNADYAVSLTPTQLAEYVRLVRLAEMMLGSPIKQPQAAEEPMMRYQVQP